MYVCGSIIADCIFLTGIFVAMCFGLARSKNHVFEMLLCAVQKTSVSSHEAVHSAGLLMANFQDNMEKLDNSNFSVAYFFGYFVFTLFVNVFIIEALHFAAIGVGLLLIMWIVLYIWYARRQKILSQAALKAKSALNALSTVVVGKVFEIRSHGLASFLETKLKAHILSATASEYDMEVWARYIELVADVFVSLFCMFFCLYVVIDLSTIAEANSMTRAEVTQRISTRSMAAFYAFAWKSTMSPLVMETNNIMTLLRGVGQMIGLANQLSQNHDGASRSQPDVDDTARKEEENAIMAVPVTGRSVATSSYSPLSLRLRKVQMRYNPRCPLVLKGLSFEAKEGTLTIIKGSSGCGKSSMFLSLLGLYPICGGDICLESAKKRESTSKKNKRCQSPEFSVLSTPVEVWRRLFTWVPQEPFLFEGTIAENLFPEVDACDLTEEHYHRAARALIDVKLLSEAAWEAEVGAVKDKSRPSAGNGANATHDCGSTLYPSSVVKAMGENLSGGERQRIGIARALLNTTARVFIMDEPTSHLNSAGCTEMLQIIKKRLCCERSAALEAHSVGVSNVTVPPPPAIVLVITHQTKAAAAATADQSILLKNGQAFF